MLFSSLNNTNETEIRDKKIDPNKNKKIKTKSNNLPLVDIGAKVLSFLAMGTIVVLKILTIMKNNDQKNTKIKEEKNYKNYTKFDTLGDLLKISIDKKHEISIDKLILSFNTIEEIFLLKNSPEVIDENYINNIKNKINSILNNFNYIFNSKQNPYAQDFCKLIRNASIFTKISINVIGGLPLLSDNDKSIIQMTSSLLSQFSLDNYMNIINILQILIKIDNKYIISLIENLPRHPVNFKKSLNNIRSFIEIISILNINIDKKNKNEVISNNITELCKEIYNPLGKHDFINTIINMNKNHNNPLNIMSEILFNIRDYNRIYGVINSNRHNFDYLSNIIYDIIINNDILKTNAYDNIYKQNFFKELLNNSSFSLIKKIILSYLELLVDNRIEDNTLKYLQETKNSLNNRYNNYNKSHNINSLILDSSNNDKYCKIYFTKMCKNFILIISILEDIQDEIINIIYHDNFYNKEKIRHGLCYIVNSVLPDPSSSAYNYTNLQLLRDMCTQLIHNLMNTSVNWNYFIDNIFVLLKEILLIRQIYLKNSYFNMNYDDSIKQSFIMIDKIGDIGITTNVTNLVISLIEECNVNSIIEILLSTKYNNVILTNHKNFVIPVSQFIEYGNKNKNKVKDLLLLIVKNKENFKNLLDNIKKGSLDWKYIYELLWNNNWKFGENDKNSVINVLNIIVDLLIITIDSNSNIIDKEFKDIINLIRNHIDNLANIFIENGIKNFDLMEFLKIFDNECVAEKLAEFINNKYKKYDIIIKKETVLNITKKILSKINVDDIKNITNIFYKDSLNHKDIYDLLLKHLDIITDILTNENIKEIIHKIIKYEFNNIIFLKNLSNDTIKGILDILLKDKSTIEAMINLYGFFECDVVLLNTKDIKNSIKQNIEKLFNLYINNYYICQLLTGYMDLFKYIYKNIIRNTIDIDNLDKKMIKKFKDFINIPFMKSLLTFDYIIPQEKIHDFIISKIKDYKFYKNNSELCNDLINSAINILENIKENDIINIFSLIYNKKLVDGIKFELEKFIKLTKDYDVNILTLINDDNPKFLKSIKSNNLTKILDIDVKITTELLQKTISIIINNLQTIFNIYDNLEDLMNGQLNNLNNASIIKLKDDILLVPELYEIIKNIIIKQIKDSEFYRNNSTLCDDLVDSIVDFLKNIKEDDIQELIDLIYNKKISSNLLKTIKNIMIKQIKDSEFYRNNSELCDDLMDSTGDFLNNIKEDDIQELIDLIYNKKFSSNLLKKTINSITLRKNSTLVINKNLSINNMEIILDFIKDSNVIDSISENLGEILNLFFSDSNKHEENSKNFINSIIKIIKTKDSSKKNSIISLLQTHMINANKIEHGALKAIDLHEVIKVFFETLEHNSDISLFFYNCYLNKNIKEYTNIDTLNARDFLDVLANEITNKVYSQLYYCIQKYASHKTLETIFKHLFTELKNPTAIVKDTII